MIRTEELSPKKHFDIIVSGGGVAGVAAAVQAAREGKSVLLLEKSQKLGGLATLGLINLFVPMCNGRGKQIIKGMAEEFLRLSIKYGYDFGLSPDYVNGQIPKEKLDAYAKEGKKPPRYMVRFSAEIFALALTELCVNEGVTLMFDSILSTPVYEEENGRTRVNGVILETKSGREYYTASLFVDATGDGDLMYRAGIPTAERGNFHSYSAFMITLDTCRRALECGNIARVVTRATGGKADLYGNRHPEDVPLYFGTTSEEVNRYLIKNQLELLESIKGIDRNTADILTLPGMAQFRTTRRVVGEYTLQLEDTFRHFEDSVGAICDFDRRDFLYEVPYRTLYSKKAINVITCGRSASAEGYAWDVLRVIPPAILTGQAAGFACALALDEGHGDVTKVCVAALQQKMQDANNIIHFDDADIPEVIRDVHEFNDQN
jgi:hypothetical protein